MGSKNKSNDKTLILTTFRNERDVLPEFVKRCVDSMKALDCDFDLLLVDDQSSDGSFEVVKDCIKKIGLSSGSTLRYCKTIRRFGVAPCVLHGLKIGSDYERVVYLDTDLQDPPELIPELIRHHNLGFKVVHTRRRSRSGESKIKMALTKFAYLFIDQVNDFDSRDMGDFKLLDQEVVNTILQIAPKDPYMRGLSQWLAGFPSAVIDYDRDAREAGETKFSLIKSINPYLELFRGLFSFSGTPLIVVGLISAICSFGLTILIMAILAMKIVGLTPPGWATLALIPSIIGSLITLVLTTLCIYTARIYDQLMHFKDVIVTEETLR